MLKEVVSNSQKLQLHAQDLERKGSVDCVCSYHVSNGWNLSTIPKPRKSRMLSFCQNKRSKNNWSILTKQVLLRSDNSNQIITRRVNLQKNKLSVFFWQMQGQWSFARLCFGETTDLCDATLCTRILVISRDRITGCNLQRPAKYQFITRCILQLDCPSVTQWDKAITFAAEVRF